MIDPVELLVKVTRKGVSPLLGLAVKNADGAAGRDRVAVILLFALLVPPGPVTVNLTV